MAKLSNINDVVNNKFYLLLEDLDKTAITYIENIVDRVRRLKANGVAPEQIAQDLTEEIFSSTGSLNSLLNKYAREIFYFGLGVSNYTKWTNYDPRGKYEWRYNSGAKHCNDCRERNGQIRYMSEWEAMGLPGSGATQCHDNCMCDIYPVLSK